MTLTSTSEGVTDHLKSRWKNLIGLVIAVTYSVRGERFMNIC